MPEAKSFGITRFRLKLFVALMLVVSALTAVAFVFAQRAAVATAKRELEREFQSELIALRNLQELRQAALEERCRTLVRRPRIHAALEDNALDLLYPSAADELRDVMQPGDSGGGPSVYGLHAEFYRFLDRNGAVIPAPNANEAGGLTPQDEARLALPGASEHVNLGYLFRRSADGAEMLSEIIAMPIFSSESGEAIAALVLGFKPSLFSSARAVSDMKRGIWMDGRIRLDSPVGSEQPAWVGEVSRAISADDSRGSNFGRRIDGAPHLLFYRRLNPASGFRPAYEICVYPLTQLGERQRELRWQVLGGGLLVLVVGLVISHIVAGNLSQPVEKLAVDSADNLAQRHRAEARLESTSEELQRAARFSADASHQLKTPVTVLRAGLEEFLARERLSPEECREISALVHQTYRLTSVIEDLLLLSRMEAGRLKIEFAPVDLSQIIEAGLDDLGVQADPFHLQVETDFPPGLRVAGEKRYISLILQNLLENARKYNRVGGCICIAACADAETVSLTVRNTGQPISPAAQLHIFERFHRGSAGENVPGHGLGLNLARELARLHRGDLRLVRSDAEWTEFEVIFRQPDSSPAQHEASV